MKISRIQRKSLWHFPGKLSGKMPGKKPESLQMPVYGHSPNGQQSIDSVAIDRDSMMHPDHIRAKSSIFYNAPQPSKCLFLFTL